MEKLSLTGFKFMCEQLAPVEFVFDTCNQDSNIISDIKMVSKYTSVIVTLKPDRICFKNEFGILCFSRVKNVLYHDDLAGIGYVFEIICGSPCDYNLNVSYKIIADKR